MLWRDGVHANENKLSADDEGLVMHIRVCSRVPEPAPKRKIREALQTQNPERPGPQTEIEDPQMGRQGRLGDEGLEPQNPKIRNIPYIRLRIPM